MINKNNFKNNKNSTNVMTNAKFGKIEVNNTKKYPGKLSN